MTPEELGKGPVDETMRQRVHAIAQETYRRRLEQTHPGHPIDAPTVMMAIEIALSDWTPPEPVDPDLIAVLEFLSKRHPGSNYYHGETGKTDALTQTCLAAYKAGRERERREPIIRSRLPFA